MSENNSNTLIQQMFETVIAKIDTLSNLITATQLDHANLRGELTTKILEMGTTFDTKLILAERRLDERHERRNEKVDGCFDVQDKAFSDYKVEMEKKITTISVKMGVIFSLATAVIVAVITVITRLIFHAPLQ